MVLQRDIIVVAADRPLARLEGRQGSVVAQGVDNPPQHVAPIGHGVILSPMHGYDVVFKVLGSLAEIGQVPVRQVDVVQPHIFTFPGVRSRMRGLPFASQTAWSLVLRPPLVRPMPWAKAPLFRRRRSDEP